MKSEVMKAPRISYKCECFDKYGTPKWEETIDNLVTTVGKNDLLDKYFAGSSYTATWYVGLIDNASWSAVNVADTMASHGGWIENNEYDEATRESISWSAASSGSKAASAPAEFTIDPTGAVIKGAFLTSVSTKGGTTGILYSAAAFGANRTLVDNDLLRVTPTMSVS